MKTQVIRSMAALLVAAGLAAPSLVLAQGGGSPDPDVSAIAGPELVAKVTGINTKRGSTLELFVYASDEDQQNDKALSRLKATLAPGVTQHTFTAKGIPAGRYMVVGVQDSNGNGELDSSWIGIPKEGYFTSKNVKMPSWEDCSFDYDGKQLVLDIEMIYW